FILHSAFAIPHSQAHPVPRSEYDRNITVEWKADGVYVTYRVEIDEYTLLTTVANPANGFPLYPQNRTAPQDVRAPYSLPMREVIPDGTGGPLDGQQVTFACTNAKVDFLDSAQFRFWFKAPAPLSPGRHTLEVEDLNFLDKKGTLVMKFGAGPGLTVEKLSE